jgi:hypothetical protein
VANVPYKASPTNEPDARPPDDYFRPDVEPLYRNYLARGLEQFGSGITKAADTWSEIQVDKQVNQALKEGDAAISDYSKLRGQDALDAQEHIHNQLEEIVTRNSSSLSPFQKDQFEKQVRPYQSRYWEGIARTHSIQQGYEFAKQTNADAEQQGYSHAAQNYNNPVEVQAGLDQAMAGAMKQLQVDGQFENDAARAHAFQVVRSNTYKAAAEAMYTHDPAGAADYVEQHRKELGVAYAPLADQFRNRAEQIEDRKTADDIRNTIRSGGVPVVPGTAPAAAPPSNVVPLRPTAQPTPGKDELGRIGGQGARIDVPFAPSMATAAGRAELIENGLKTYQPGTKVIIAGREITIPPAGTTFQFEGKSYTVPGAKPPEATAQRMNFAPEFTPNPASEADKREAPIRTNNPGAQWPGKISQAYGSTGHEYLRDGNKIATFPTPIHGAAANMALLADKYGGMTVGAIQSRWSGEHRSSLPGYPNDMKVTPAMLNDRRFMITFMKNMAEAEAKAGSTVMTDQQWQQAFDMYQQVGTGAVAER